ncbi:MAG: hypothetical protein GVY10_04240 [Verrucomicrobia bacterium]|nr:hypothetical protein [Verrucomicrobiota bacterium]
MAVQALGQQSGGPGGIRFAALFVPQKQSTEASAPPAHNGASLRIQHLAFLHSCLAGKQLLQPAFFHAGQAGGADLDLAADRPLLQIEGKEKAFPVDDGLGLHLAAPPMA